MQTCDGTQGDKALLCGDQVVLRYVIIVFDLGFLRWGRGDLVCLSSTSQGIISFDLVAYVRDVCPLVDGKNAANGWDLSMWLVFSSPRCVWFMAHVTAVVAR